MELPPSKCTLDYTRTKVLPQLTANFRMCSFRAKTIFEFSQWTVRAASANRWNNARITYAFHLTQWIVAVAYGFAVLYDLITVVALIIVLRRSRTGMNRYVRHFPKEDCIMTLCSRCEGPTLSSTRLCCTR